MITIMRRIMMRISERLAMQINAGALVTGESLGQVASQTMQSITVTNKVIERLPVFRPLIGFDKEEIVKISKHIDAFETSILPYQDCCTIFLPKNPVIRPKLELIERAEKALDVEGLIKRAMDNIEVIEVKH
jgi:thiamine biosynthesis protein ThiI